MYVNLSHPRFSFRGLESETITYISAVESADNQFLEKPVILSIDNFVKQCKLDGIWDAIKSCCILIGARTLSGALVPLKGSAPTNVNNNFTSSDYNRKTGLIGNASNKYLNTNRSDSADPNLSIHQSVFLNSHQTSGFGLYIGTGGGQNGATHFGFEISPTQIIARNRNDGGGAFLISRSPTKAFMGSTRSNSTSYTVRYNGENHTNPQTARANLGINHFIFATNNNGSPNNLSNARISFYSIGESIDLQKLEDRVTILVESIEFTINTGIIGYNYDVDTLRYINLAYASGGIL
jgi:hypothetical protein